MSQSLSPDLSKITDLIRYEIFIPIADNEGELFEGDDFDSVTEELMKTFGGVTLDYPYGGSGGVDGMWLSSLTNIVYRDRIAVVMALSKATTGAHSTMRRFQRRWEQLFKQEKILILSHRVQAI